MNDGYLIVYGPTTDMEAPIDFDESFTINGGYLIALGSSGMALPLSDTSTQASMLYVGSTTYKAGSNVSLLDEEGQSLVSLTALKNFTSVTLSTKDMVIDSSYTLSLDGDDTDFTITSMVTTLGYVSQNMPGGGLPPRR